MPDELRGPLLEHLEDLRAKYLASGWGNRVGFGARPALFFTSYAHDPDEPPRPRPEKLTMQIPEDAGDLFDLDPSLGRRPGEKLICKRYASAFKGTNFHEMLASLGIDTLIVTGVSTGHCVYATCRDATDSYRVIVPREAVGERCELMHEVNLLDIDLDLGDVTPLQDVVDRLARLPEPAPQ